MTTDKTVAAYLNPLIVTDSPEDTMFGVVEVLTFISGAMENAENGEPSIPMPGGCSGLSRILDTCIAALNFHRAREDSAS